MAALDQRRGSSGPDIFLIAGESSGDELGAGLMDALRALSPDVRLRGIGGPSMAARGLKSLFPMADIAVMGFVPVIANLPRLLARIRQAANAIVDEPPELLVIIDSPDFTHRVARKVRANRPAIPIVDYVSPTVWAWRPGRARRMRAYIDHVLALLPFEPQAHRDLGGPECTYVGHPLVEQIDALRGDGRERSTAEAPVLAILPGSRRSEIQRLMPVFGETFAALKQDMPALSAILPAVPHLAEPIAELAGRWPHQPEIVAGEEEKRRAFRRARAALAASGTVTLELALAQTPTILAYKVLPIEAAIAPYVLRTPFIGLPNIIAGRAIVPEFIQKPATPEAMAAALRPLLADSPERVAQLAGFAEVETAMVLPEGQTPSSRAARIVFEVLRNARTAHAAG